MDQLYAPLDTQKFLELSDTDAEKIINLEPISGLDPRSVRRLVWTNPTIFLTSLKQKFYDLLLYIYRAGWTGFDQEERNAVPWLTTALDWGLSSDELYANAHGLPDKHPLKKPALSAYQEMAEWETHHPWISTLTARSKPLDKLIGQPVPIGSDGWPINLLDGNGDLREDEDILAVTHLLYHRRQPLISSYLKKTLAKAALKALQSGRLSVIKG